MARADTTLLSQLNVNSEPYHDPLAQLEWHSLSLDDYWLPRSALSLNGVAEFEQVPESVKKRLSQYEFIGFIQAGIWLEGIFVERLGRTLKHTASLLEYAYHLHEIREEAGHSLMFLKLMEKSGLHLPAAAFHRPRFADFMGRHAPVNAALFWLAVVIGEEVTDRLNRHVRAHGDPGLNPLVRQMCTLHIIDEARHIARARSALESSLSRVGPLGRAGLRPLVRMLLGQFTRTFYLPRPQVYELAGLTPGWHWQALARTNPARQAWVRQSLNPTLNLLARHGLEVSVPSL